ncbi:hypothetical protein C8R43DRAFT_1229237 [Mycena crocata]|nr:hypothetical protein C8R43DRAFT_1229237 [Mycena crocata]
MPCTQAEASHQNSIFGRPANSVAAPLSIVAASTSRQRPNTSCTSAELGPELKFDFWPSGEVHRGTAIQHHLDVQHSRLRAHSALGVKFTIFFLRLRRGVYLGWEGLLVRKDVFLAAPATFTPVGSKLRISPAAGAFLTKTRRRESPRQSAIYPLFLHQNFEFFPPEANTAPTLKASGLEPHFEV